MAATATLRLTAEQDRAIRTRRVSVGLSAGAGCGKTSVLTERFLSHLDPATTGGKPAKLSQLVAITFTDKAAREMRDRIRRACQTRQLTAVSDDEARYWLGILRQLERARISTIHAFCTSLLRRHAVEAGLDPRFAILEPAQATTILSELIDDFLRERLAARDERVLELAFEYGLNTLGEMLRLLLYQRHEIDFGVWLDQTPDDLVARWKRLNEECVVPTFVERFFSDPVVAGVRDLIKNYPTSHEAMSGNCRQIESLLPQVRATPGMVGRLRELRELAKVQGVVTAKSMGDADLYARYRDAFKAFRDEIDSLLKRLQFDEAMARSAAAMGLDLLAVGRPVIEAYEARKRELGFLDFDDLLIQARDLLFDPRNESLLSRLADGIELLLVDEFQDTDPLQVKLVEALCGDPRTASKLFVVGDFKQSIYRFRGAEPRLFHELLTRIAREGQLHLTENFRSQPAILKFVNALFSASFGDQYQPLRPNRRQVSPEPAIEFLWASCPDAELAKSEHAPEHRRREARWIARRLRQMIESGEPLVYVAGQDGAPPTARAARPGDIAILFRAMSDTQHYEQALRDEGLAYYVVGGKAFYAQQEVYDIVNLLRAVENPADDVSLAGALRSPLFSLSDETLFWLGQHRGGLGAGLFARDSLPDLDAEQSRRVAHAAATMLSLRSLKNRLSITALLNEVWRQTGYDAALLGEFLGERKLANLRKLVEQARLFDAAGAFTLADFIAQLVEFVSTQPDEAIAATHAENSDVVRLMSIHQAKGLEFPIVVVPDLERKQKHQPPAADYHPEWGPLVKRPQTAADKAIGGLELFQLVEAAHDDAEHVRLLYVATTRAADYLLLSSSLPDIDKPQEAWVRLLAERFDLRTGACRVELPDEATPRVRVTLSEPQVGKAPSQRRRSKLGALTIEAEAAAREQRSSTLRRIAPLEPDLTARRQYSFSRLSGKLHVEEPQHDEDEATAPSTVDARSLGSLVHELLELPDVSRVCSSGAQNEERLRAIGRRHGVTEATDLVAAREMVARYASGPRAQAIAAAAQVHREMEFLLAWPSEAKPDLGYTIHGLIDCVYRDAAGRWNIVDYKTNQLPGGRVADVARRYELQLLIYAAAVEQSIGEPPATLTLHFLRGGEEFGFDWDAAARSRLKTLMTQALAEAHAPRDLPEAILT